MRRWFLVPFLIACGPSGSAVPAGTPEAGAGRDAAVPSDGGGVSVLGHVASYDPSSWRAAADVLREGGTAADAFVTATLVEYVVLPGVTSLAGPLGALVYEPATSGVRSLDAGFVAPANPGGRYDPVDPVPGRAVFVPGALRGLELLWQRDGRLSWARLFEPAIRFAEDGFVIDEGYAAVLRLREDVLARSAYGRRTFIPDGVLLGAGDRLRQPELASLLRRVASQGADVMYEGAWAQAMVDEVASAGGELSLDDLAGYRARFGEPFRLPYRGAIVHGQSGSTYGGVWVLLALATLEHGEVRLAEAGRVDRLEWLLRTARAVHAAAWLRDPHVLDDREEVANRLAHPDEVWARVEAGIGGAAARAHSAHSSHITVVDRDGRIVTGTHTIHSLAWGEGLFVDGVPLTAAGASVWPAPEPGARVVTALTNHLAMVEGRPVLAGGTFGSSLLEAQLQVLTGLLDEGLSVERVAARPRFGTFPYDFEHPERGVDTDRNWIDADLPPEEVAALEGRGLLLTPEPFADLGLGTFVSFDETWHGAALDSWVEGRAGPVYP